MNPQLDDLRSPILASALRIIVPIRNLALLSSLLIFGMPLHAQLNQHAPVWSAYSSGHFYHRDFSVPFYSTTTYPYALPLQDPVSVSYGFPSYSQPGNGFYEYSQGTGFTDSRDSSQRCTIPPGDTNQSTANPNRYWIIGGTYNHGVPIQRVPQSAHVSDLESGIKGFTFQGDFSGTATGSSNDAALAVMFYHQDPCYAGHFESGFAYDFVPKYYAYPYNTVQKSPFYFYWSQDTNCYGTCFEDSSGITPVGAQVGTTNDQADSSNTLRYTPLPDLRTTANSASTYLWGVSVYFDYSSGSNFRVQIYDPYTYSVIYDYVITPVFTDYSQPSPYPTTSFATDQVSGGAAGSPSYAVNGTSAYVTAGFSLVGSPTAGGTAPTFNLAFVDAGK